MSRGRRPQFDYQRIADEYNLWYGKHEAKANASQVRQDILGNKALFERFARQWCFGEAYFYLRLALDERVSKDEVEQRSLASPPLVPFIESYQPSTDYEPRLPKWFRRVLGAWLDSIHQVEGRPRDPLVPRGRDYSSGISLSLYLMADCLQDERFVWAMNSVRAIWRMGEHDGNSWYRWLHGQQESAVQRQFPSGLPSTDALRPLESYGRGQGLGFADPLDDRNADGELAHGPYGLPVQDYKSHLGQLVRLAGGSPDSEGWQDWVERLLWDLGEREVIFPLEVGGWVKTSWLRREFLTVAWQVEGRYVPHAPPTRPTLRTERESRGQASVQIDIPSRWVSLRDAPADLRYDLLSAIARIWGAYRHLPSHNDRVRRFQRLIDDADTASDELAPKYEEWESEIARLPVEQQEGPEALRISDEQNKQESRILAKHAKRRQRGRKRLQA